MCKEKKKAIRIATMKTTTKEKQHNNYITTTIQNYIQEYCVSNTPLQFAFRNLPENRKRGYKLKLNQLI